MPGPPLLKRGQGSTNNWPLRGSSSAAPMPRSQVGRLDALLGRRSTHLSGVCHEILGPSPPTSTPALGLDRRRHPFERFGREEGTHLVVPRLVPADAGDGPDL